jgi:hypothetical protein
MKLRLYSTNQGCGKLNFEKREREARTRTHQKKSENEIRETRPLKSTRNTRKREREREISKFLKIFFIHFENFFSKH